MELKHCIFSLECIRINDSQLDINLHFFLRGMVTTLWFDWFLVLSRFFYVCPWSQWIFKVGPLVKSRWQFSTILTSQPANNMFFYMVSVPWAGKINWILVYDWLHEQLGKMTLHLYLACLGFFRNTNERLLNIGRSPKNEFSKEHTTKEFGSQKPTINLF